MLLLSGIKPPSLIAHLISRGGVILGKLVCQLTPDILGKVPLITCARQIFRIHMDKKQVVLDDWHIMYADCILNKTLNIVTGAQLSDFEAFLNAYIFFDEIYVSEKHTHSSFLEKLDLDKTIFKFCNDININPKDFSSLSIDVFLDVKNFRYLNSSAIWAEQGIPFNLSQKDRKKIIKESGHIIEDYYYFILHHYKTLMINSMTKNAFSLLSSSRACIQPVILQELPLIADNLLSKSKFKKYRNYLKEGIYCDVEAAETEFKFQFKSPSVLTEFINYTRDSDDYFSILIFLRKKYGDFRDYLGKIAIQLIEHPDCFKKYYPFELEKNNLSLFIKDLYGDISTTDCMFKKAMVCSVKINKNLANNFSKDNIIRNTMDKSYHYKYYSSIDYISIKNAPKFIKELIPLDIKRAFNSYKKTLSFEKLYTSGVSTNIITLMTRGVQVRPGDKNNEGVLLYCNDNPPHIYMICTRPKIMFDPKIMEYNDSFLVNFIVKNSFRYPIVFSKSDIKHIVRIEPPFTEMTYISNNGQKVCCVASILFQQYIKNLIPIDVPIFMVDENKDLNKYDWPSDLFNFTDLKVQYIGRSLGKKGKRTALDRLVGHEPLQKVQSYVNEKEPTLEIWLILLPFDKQSSITEFSPTSNIDANVNKFLMRSKAPESLDLEAKVNFTELALINYFSPQFNENKYENFPSTKHNSYNSCYSNNFENVTFELQTHESFGCRLYSDQIRPKFLHFKTYDFLKVPSLPEMKPVAS